MNPSQGRRVLIAVDTNVLLDLAGEVEDITDAVLALRRRLRQTQLLMPPTVREELAAEALRAEDFDQRERAVHAFQLARSWSIQPIDMVETQHETARRIGRRLRGLGLLPEPEINDGRVLAESALLSCSILLTSDEHLRGLDFERLTFELRAFEVAPPIIATPREIVRKFFR
jgi:predicted nucleic acid-binding protein